MDIAQLLGFGVQQGASDCHLSSGEPPMLRLNGEIKSSTILPSANKKSMPWSTT